MRIAGNKARCSMIVQLWDEDLGEEVCLRLGGVTTTDISLVFYSVCGACTLSLIYSAR